MICEKIHWTAQWIRLRLLGPRPVPSLPSRAPCYPSHSATPRFPSPPHPPPLLCRCLHSPPPSQLPLLEVLPRRPLRVASDIMSSTLLWGCVGTLVPIMSNSLRKLPLMRRTFSSFLFLLSFCPCSYSASMAGFWQWGWRDALPIRPHLHPLPCGCVVRCVPLLADRLTDVVNGSAGCCFAGPTPPPKSAPSSSWRPRADASVVPSRDRLSPLGWPRSSSSRSRSQILSPSPWHSSLRFSLSPSFPSRSSVPLRPPLSIRSSPIPSRPAGPWEHVIAFGGGVVFGKGVDSYVHTAHLPFPW